MADETICIPVFLLLFLLAANVMNLKGIIYRLLGYKTLEELMAELQSGRRRFINETQMNRAIKLEQAMLPANLRFPKHDEVWESLHDVQVDYMSSYCAPYTGGGEAILPAGERIRCSQPRERCIGAYFHVINYDNLHERIVAEEERTNPKYTGYYLSIDTVDLNRHFKPVEPSV